MKFTTIPDHTLYEISRSGIVKNKKTGRIMKTHIDSVGYCALGIYKDSIQKITLVRIHRLMGVTFIPNPNDKPAVIHKNGIRLDNTIRNLKWATRSEMSLHSHTAGNGLHADSCLLSKLTLAKVMKIKELINQSIKLSTIAKEYNVTWSCIYDIKRGRTWKQ